MRLLLKGDAKGALSEIEQETSELWKMVGLPIAYHALGRKAESDAALAALIAKYEKDASSNIASVYAFRGEADKAFAWLDKAVEYGDPGLTEIVAENLFDKIHGDPRWLPFLRKVGYALPVITDTRCSGLCAARIVINCGKDRVGPRSSLKWHQCCYA